jgi:hypothetical protein
MSLPLPKLAALRALLAPLGREVKVSKREDYVMVSSEDMDGKAFEEALEAFGLEFQGRRFKNVAKTSSSAFWAGHPIGEVYGGRWDFRHLYTFAPKEA